MIFEQTPDELLARVVLGRLFLRIGFGLGQEDARLDVQERRGHADELAGHVEVDLLHRLERLQILLGDQGDGDVEDVDLVLVDEVQQQVERALEIGQHEFEGEGRMEGVSGLDRARVPGLWRVCVRRVFPDLGHRFAGPGLFAVGGRASLGVAVRRVAVG